MRKRTALLIAGTLLVFTALATGIIVNSWASVSTADNASNQPLALQQPAAAPADSVASVANQDLDGLDQFAGLDQTLPDPSELNAQIQAAAAAIPGFEAFAARFGPGPIGGADSPEVQGIISATTSTTITLNNKRVINVNAQTSYGDANGTLNLPDLKAGDRIFALGKVETDKSLTARWVLRLPALPSVLSGAISSVDTANNTFKFKVGKDNTEWTVTVTSSTKITKNGSDIKLSDLTAGDRVAVVGKADKNAKAVEATNVSTGRPPMPNPGNVVHGKIKSIDTSKNSLVVTVTGPNNTQTDQTVTVDSNTKFVGNNIKSLADLKVGDEVSAFGAKQSDGSLKAQFVGNGPMPGPGRPGSPRGGKGMPGGPRGGNGGNNNTTNG
jgi:hypothetical protein